MYFFKFCTGYSEYGGWKGATSQENWQDAEKGMAQFTSMVKRHGIFAKI